MKLGRAETLIISLGGEIARWTQSAKDLGEDSVNLTGDVIVASGLVAYLGAFTPDLRAIAVKEWATFSAEKSIPGGANLIAEVEVIPPTRRRARGTRCGPSSTSSGTRC